MRESPGADLPPGPDLPSRAGLGRGLRWAAQLGLTLLATFFLFRSLQLSWGEIRGLDPASWSPRPLPLAGSLLVLLAVFIYLVALWSRLVSALGGPLLGLRIAVQIFFTANLGRYIPGKIWQLASLTYLAEQRGVSLGVSSSGAILAQLFSLGAAFIVAGVFLVFGPSSHFPRALAPWALVFVAVIAALTSLPRLLRMALRFAFKLGRDPHDVPELSGGFGLRWTALHLPAWIGYGVGFGLLWSAFPALPAVSWPAAIGTFAGAYFIGYAAIFAPAGIGVREGIMAVLLAPWVGASQAAVLAVIARMWMTLAELLPLLGLGARAGLAKLRDQPDTRDHAV